MSERLSRIEQSATVRIADLARKREAAGESVIKLQTGDPDFDTPPPIVEAAARALRDGRTHYSASRGLPALREAIASKLSSENGLRYDPGFEILVTQGGIHGLFCTMSALLDERDEVLIPDPSWMPYTAISHILGARPVRIPTAEENGFKLTPALLERHLGHRARLLVINSPNNPSGALYSEEELSALADVVSGSHLCVISDDVYERIVYDGRRAVSFASLPGMRERTVVLNSFSKTYAMTGWRIGYVSGPREILDQVLKASQYTITNVAECLQMGALAALTDGSIGEYVDGFLRTYESRRSLLLSSLGRMESIDVVEPGGAFYLLLRHSTLGESFADELLKEGIFTAPGIVYGECTRKFIRVSYSVKIEVLQRFMEHLEKEYS